MAGVHSDVELLAGPPKRDVRARELTQRHPSDVPETVQALGSVSEHIEAVCEIVVVSAQDERLPEVRAQRQLPRDAMRVAGAGRLGGYSRSPQDPIR
jgi:hypothetical protein